MSWTPPGRAAAPEPTPVDVPVWRLVKGARVAVAVVRMHRHGQELRVEVDGSFLWSQVFKDGDGRALGTVADEHRAAFEAKGWILNTA